MWPSAGMPACATTSMKRVPHAADYESAPSSIASNDNFSASYSDFADCIGSAKLINVLGAESSRLSKSQVFLGYVLYLRYLYLTVLRQQPLLQ